MQWKQIIRAAFDLTDEEWDQAVKLRELGEADRTLLMERLGPQKPAAKKSSKKAGKKSARASSLAEKVQGSASRTIVGPACSICGNVEDHPDHDVAHYLSAHEFNTGKSGVQSAAQGSTPASSEIGKGVAGVVAQGAGGGD